MGTANTINRPRLWTKGWEVCEISLLRVGAGRRHWKPRVVGRPWDHPGCRLSRFARRDIDGQGTLQHHLQGSSLVDANILAAGQQYGRQAYDATNASADSCSTHATTCNRADRRAAAGRLRHGA